jgi:hypothetical protein
MQHRSYVRRVHNLARIGVLLLSFLLLLSVPSISQAQSGRRPPKKPESPDPLPPKQEEPAKPSSDDKSKSQIPVRVVWYLGMISSSTIYTRTVEEGCLERLSQSGSVKAAPAEDVNRKQASDMAKASTDTYVLWFELQVDSAYNDRSGMGNIPPQYLQVRYEVFIPTTGKTKTSGNIYQRSRGPGGLPLPLPGTTASAAYSLRYAGREMADRLLDTLGLPRPADR